MKKLVCLFSDLPVGGTFVDWSMYFLSGQDNFYSVEHNSVIPLSQDPVSNKNAHSHKKNHPDGFEMTRDYFDKFSKSDCDVDFFSTYTYPYLLLRVKNLLGLDTASPTDLQKIKAYQSADIVQLFDWCHDSSIKVVHVSSKGISPLYLLNPRYPGFFVPGTQQFKNNRYDKIWELFYQDSITKWQLSDETDIWDIRERLALDIRPFDMYEIPVGSSHDHLRLNCQDIWTREDAIFEVIDYVDLPLLDNRIPVWREIYRRWQTIQFQHLKFCHYFEDIVEAVVNNWYMKIDLTFIEEAVIQHALIYQHGLNLKTWNLKQFPKNTQDLHKLLESNIHSVESIY